MTAQFELTDDQIAIRDMARRFTADAITPFAAQWDEDHVFPRDRGGQMSWENIVCSCIPCNTRKGNRTPEQARMKLIRKPERPKWRPFAHLTFGAEHHDSWRHFVDFAYWNVELGE